MSEEKKKNWFARHKVLTVIIAIVILIGVAGSGGSDTTTDTSMDSKPSDEKAAQMDNQEKTAEIQVKEEVSYEVVDAEALIEAFDSNQLAAEKTYKDKSIEITAKIKNISEDIMGTPFLSLEPSNAEEYYFGTTIQCLFENKDDLLSVANGKIVTTQGIVGEQSLGIIVIKDCKLVE